MWFICCLINICNSFIMFSVLPYCCCIECDLCIALYAGYVLLIDCRYWEEFYDCGEISISRWGNFFSVESFYQKNLFVYIRNFCLFKTCGSLSFISWSCLEKFLYWSFHVHYQKSPFCPFYSTKTTKQHIYNK